MNLKPSQVYAFMRGDRFGIVVAAAELRQAWREAHHPEHAQQTARELRRSPDRVLRVVPRCRNCTETQRKGSVYCKRCER